MQTTLEAETELMEAIRNVRFFKENLERIRRDYPEKYVVIKNQQIIDSGADVHKLNDLYLGQNALIVSYFDGIKKYLESPLADSPNEYN